MNNIRRSRGEKIFGVFNAVFMTVIIILCLYPVVYVLFASLSSASKLLSHTGLLFAPLDFTVDAYMRVFQYPMILKGYANTIFIVVVGVALNMAMTILGAFFISRKKVKWKKPIMLMILFTMFFSGGLIPFYLTVRSLGLENSQWALIFPSLINTFNLIIMRTGFEVIPDSLEESVEIDGGNHFVTLTRICIPLIMPTLAVITLYYAVEKWNAWFHAAIFLNDRTKYPLQLVLREILISNDTTKMTSNVEVGDAESVADTIKYAIIMVATVPILCLYPFLQKYFMKGILIGSVKG